MVTTTAREENGEFCVAVAPSTRTVGILTQLVKGAGCQINEKTFQSNCHHYLKTGWLDVLHMSSGMIAVQLCSISVRA